MANGDSGWTRVPAILNFPDTAAFAETYGFAAGSGQVWLEGQYLIPRAPSKTLYLFMHPSGTLQLLPMPQALAGAGLHVLCAASRYPKNDSGLIMEKVAIDMGAWVRDARAREYEKVILVGWSGGGSLSLFYQAEPRRRRSPQPRPATRWTLRAPVSNRPTASSLSPRICRGPRP